MQTSCKLHWETSQLQETASDKTYGDDGECTGKGMDALETKQKPLCWVTNVSERTKYLVLLKKNKNKEKPFVHAGEHRARHELQSSATQPSNSSLTKTRAKDRHHFCFFLL